MWATTHLLRLVSSHPPPLPTTTMSNVCMSGRVVRGVGAAGLSDSPNMRGTVASQLATLDVQGTRFSSLVEQNSLAVVMAYGNEGEIKQELDDSRW